MGLAASGFGHKVLMGLEVNSPDLQLLLHLFEIYEFALAWS
jgi:hypothetical protein